MDVTTAFTPLSALTGGVLIGFASLILMAGIGRIAGISGIVGQMIRPGRLPIGPDRLWRLSFLTGLVLAPLVYRSIADPITVEVNAHPVMVIIAGLLVGLGTQIGSGCTSGHGVCGLARLSQRSVVATASFMITGAITVFILRHWV